jgi:hypothetical protein
MAEAKSRPTSTRAYFRKLFEEHPEWLNASDNAAIRKRFLADRGREMSRREGYSMANIKSQLRKMREQQSSISTTQEPANHADHEPPVPSRRGRRRGALSLESLELMLDECLFAVRKMNDDNLASVIKHLRKARNAVSALLDEPD